MNGSYHEFHPSPRLAPYIECYWSLRATDRMVRSNYVAAAIRRFLMSNAANNFRIDYIEFPATDIAITKAFYQGVFEWNFVDYGPDYTSFHDGRIAGGFTTDASVSPGGVLIVLYATDLKAVESKIKEFGGSIIKEVFDFPGGRRFHFADPSGNVLAVWSDQ